MLLMEQPSSQGPAKISGLAPWLICHQLTIEAEQSLRLAVGWGTATERRTRAWHRQNRRTEEPDCSPRFCAPGVGTSRDCFLSRQL